MQRQESGATFLPLYSPLSCLCIQHFPTFVFATFLPLYSPLFRLCIDFALPLHSLGFHLWIRDFPAFVFATFLPLYSNTKARKWRIQRQGSRESKGGNLANAKAMQNQCKGGKVVNTKAGKWRIQRQESGESKGGKL